MTKQANAHTYTRTHTHTHTHRERERERERTRPFKSNARRNSYKRQDYNQRQWPSQINF